jgi:hypothetical protein
MRSKARLKRRLSDELWKKNPRATIEVAISPCPNKGPELRLELSLEAFGRYQDQIPLHRVLNYS